MKCRICKSEAEIFLDLGNQPIANNLMDVPDCKTNYRLKLAFCHVCGMVQLVDCIPRDMMFNDKYPYYTSSSAFMQRHFKRLADLVRDEYLPQDGLIVEIGSNDGTFLRNFEWYRHIGIEPCSNVSGKSFNNLNVETAFFNENLAFDIAKTYGYSDVIVSTNTFPHIEDRDTVLRGIKNLLKQDGIWINEEAYLGSIIANVSYDQFYNEHIYTSSVGSFKNNVQRYGLEVINCEFQSVHGGSMRYYVTHQNNAIKQLPHLRNILYIICQEDLINYSKLAHFSEQVAKSKERFLSSLKKVGKPVVGYGATAKCSTILNYCGIDRSMIDRIYDNIPDKQGKYIPGTDIPIVPYDDFDKDAPENVVLFAWNHMKEIYEKESNKPWKINWILPI